MGVFTIELRKWQIEAEKYFFEKNCNSLFSVPTGAGKTFFAIYIMKKMLEKEPSLRVLIISPTNVILEMWQKELSAHGFSFNKVGIYNGKCKEYSKITLTTTSSIKRINKGIFDFLIADEIHMMGTDSLLKVLELPFKYKLGLSATMDRQDHKHWKIYEIFQFNIFKYEMKEALEDGVLNKFDFYDVVLELDDKERQLYDELSMSIGMMMKEIGSFERFLEMSSDDPRKAKLSGLIAKRKDLIWNNPQKMEIVCKLCKRFMSKDSKIIIFSEYNQTTNSLYYYLGSEGMKAGVFHSGVKQKDRKYDMEKFENGNYNILLATKVLDQGMNIPSIDIGIILAGESTTRQAVQRLGRCLRKKENNSILFQVFFKDTFEEDTSRERTQLYKEMASKYEELEM